MVISQLHREGFGIEPLCQSLGVCRSAWYAWQTAPATARRVEDNQLRPTVREIFFAHRRRYGARRIVAELSDVGISTSRRRVRRVMTEMGLAAIQPRSFKPRTTDSQHTLGYSPNLLLESTTPKNINQVWVGDITYVPLAGQEFMYLAVLLDLFSRRIIGWAMENHMQESLVIAALQMALSFRKIKPGLIHHTDRGGQYAGTRYRDRLAQVEMLQSMSRADNCYDNAVMESSFGTLKTELEMKVYENEVIAQRNSSLHPILQCKAASFCLGLSQSRSL